MKKSRWSSMLAVILLILGITPRCTVAQGNDVVSGNIVGHTSFAEKTISADGEVVTIGGVNSTFELSGTRLSVSLTCKNTTFRGEVSSKTIAGLTIAPVWVRATGMVERITIGGQDLALTRSAIQNGCVATRQYGEIPVYFHYAGEFPNPARTNICILVFGDEQVESLRASLLENEDRQSRPPKPPNRVTATNQVSEQRKGRP
jgi:hypothetical protein